MKNLILINTLLFLLGMLLYHASDIFVVKRYDIEHQSAVAELNANAPERKNWVIVTDVFLFPYESVFAFIGLTIIMIFSNRKLTLSRGSTINYCRLIPLCILFSALAFISLYASYIVFD